MTKTLMIFEKDCIGCYACEVACKEEHGLGVGPRLIRILGKDPDFVPVYCHHCAKAPCKEACPTEAIFRNDQGIVLINKEECIGCKACPFGAMQFDEKTELAVNCDLCIERLRNGESPACGKACPTRCVFWGDVRGLSERIAGEA